jgi:4-carboxymuconolactone decarboxylase
MAAAGPSPRIAPLEPPYSPEIETLLSKWMPPGADVEPLRLFRTLANNEEIASRMRPLGAGILGASASIAPALREVMIHRTCALSANEYEWGVHAAAFGRPLGLDDEQLASTVRGSWGDDCWDAEQASVFRLADELHRTSAISDELWSSLRARFDDVQIIELLVMAGWYRLIAYICNGLLLETEEWAPAFPAGGAPVGTAAAG